MKLGMQEGLGPGHILLDGTQLPFPKKAGIAAPQFLAHIYCGQTAGWIKMPLSTKVRLGTGNTVRWDPAPPKGAQPPPQFLTHVCCGKTAVGIKTPLGMEVGLSPGNFVVDGDPAPPPQKGVEPPQIFDPCLLWPNGWMHQDGTWHGGRPQSRRLCVIWGTRPLPKKGAQPPPQFSAHFYCGQTAGCIKMHRIDVGLNPGDFVLDDDPARPSQK